MYVNTLTYAAHKCKGNPASIVDLYDPSNFVSSSTTISSHTKLGRFLVSGLNERHRTGSDRTEQRTGTNGTAFPLDRSMTVWYSLENERS